MAEINLISGPLQKEYQQINGAWEKFGHKIAVPKVSHRNISKQNVFRKMPWTFPIIVLLSPLALADQSGHVHNVRIIVFLSELTHC